jgi:glycyl-tRNA synthetase
MKKPNIEFREFDSIEDKQNKLRTALNENSYIIGSYQTYGGDAGFHNYGILGKRIKNHLVDLWRLHFMCDSIVEIETPALMPSRILEASGHVERFTDYIVTDTLGIEHRADHLLKNYFKNHIHTHVCECNFLIDQVDSFNQSTLEKYINDFKILKNIYDIKNIDIKNIDDKVSCPNTHYAVTRKHLMYNVEQNDNKDIKYLRPELAQGIFVSYTHCQNFLQKQPPFGIAQTGSSYRKEISPQPYIRMREFSQAEIEYFFDPLNPSYPDNNFTNEDLPLVTQDMQLNSEFTPRIVSVRDAVTFSLIKTEIMAYFLGKIVKFAIAIGLKNYRLREHLPNEMSHYAKECWDLETFVDGDWLECIGCANRGDYDLNAHNTHGISKVFAKRLLETPITTELLKLQPNMKKIGKKYTSLSGRIKEEIESRFATQDALRHLKKYASNPKFEGIFITLDNKSYSIETSMFDIITYTDTKTHQQYVPHTLEPSFGIDRLIYSICNQNFWCRKGDENRIVLSLPTTLVPYNVAIFPLSKKPVFDAAIDTVASECKKLQVFYDNSNTSIGKKYSRADEMGIPYAITIDFETINPDSELVNTVTVRQRDSTLQERVKISELKMYFKNN